MCMTCRRQSGSGRPVSHQPLLPHWYVLPFGLSCWHLQQHHGPVQLHLLPPWLLLPWELHHLWGLPMSWGLRVPTGHRVCHSVPLSTGHLSQWLIGSVIWRLLCMSSWTVLWNIRAGFTYSSLWPRWGLWLTHFNNLFPRSTKGMNSHVLHPWFAFTIVKAWWWLISKVHMFILKSRKITLFTNLPTNKDCMQITTLYWVFIVHLTHFYQCLTTNFFCQVTIASWEHMWQTQRTTITTHMETVCAQPMWQGVSVGLGTTALRAPKNQYLVRRANTAKHLVGTLQSYRGAGQGIKENKAHDKSCSGNLINNR